MSVNIAPQKNAQLQIKLVCSFKRFRTRIVNLMKKALGISNFITKLLWIKCTMNYNYMLQDM